MQAWSVPGEQGFSIRTFGDTTRKIVEIEGLQLVSCTR
jgi:CRISPR-associated endoribonuclease Cas2 subtype I-E